MNPKTGAPKPAAPGGGRRARRGAALVLATAALGLLACAPPPEGPPGSIAGQAAPSPPPSTPTVEAGPPPVDASTDAEAFVGELAFLPGGADLAFTADGAYPHGHAVFAQALDPISGQLAPTATLLSGTPEGFSFWGLRAAREEGGGLFLEADGRSGDEIGAPMYPRALFHLSDDAATLKRLTEPEEEIATYLPSQDGARVIYLKPDGELVELELATANTRTLTTGLLNAVGLPSARLALSEDARRLAIVDLPELNLHRLSLLDLETGERVDRVDLPSPEDADATVSAPVFGLDGDRLWFTVCWDGMALEGFSGQFHCELQALHPDGDGPPEVLADLTALTGVTDLRSVTLLRHPARDSLIFKHGEGIYGIDPAAPTELQRLSPPGDRVVGDLAVTTTETGSWLAYAVDRPVSSAGGGPTYYHRSGEPLEHGSFAVLRSLP